MPPSINTFSDAEIVLLKRIINDVQNLRETHRTRSPHTEPDFTTPEVYIARVPSAGIPAMTYPSGTAISGTGSEGAGDVPGSATCEIYQMINGALVDCYFSKVIYNINSSAVPGSRFIMVNRDKYGTWIAQIPGNTSAISGFYGTALGYIAMGTTGTVLDSHGTRYSVVAALGQLDFGTAVWVGKDSITGEYIAVSVPCPSGTGTGTGGS